MHLVHLVLTSPDTPRPSPAQAERILDTLWAHLDPQSGIEHIRTRSGPDAVDLGLYFAGDGRGAEERERADIGRLLSNLPDWNSAIP